MKKERREKKSMKKQCKTAEGGKTNGFDSWETLYPVLQLRDDQPFTIVKGGKVDFSPICIRDKFDQKKYF